LGDTLVMQQDATAIERFMRNRCGAFLPVRKNGRRGFVAQMAIGGAFTAAGVGLFTIGSQLRISGMESGSIGPLIAGLTNLLVGSIFYSKARGRTGEDAKVTPEARAFLMELNRLTSGMTWEWSDPSMMDYQYGWNRRPGVRRGSLILGVRKGKGPREALPAPLFDLLERACHEYNRVSGVVQLATNTSPVKKLSDAALNGSDETILEVFHQAALVSRYPESSAAATQTMELRIAALQELANGLEQLQTRQPALSDRLNATSAMERVLEELKLDAMAREELGARPEVVSLDHRG
jgi:hypothetical protein